MISFNSATASGLQWVPGQRTVVIFGPAAGALPLIVLQWVHGQRPVVMVGTAAVFAGSVPKLQWVHGQRTVVMLAGGGPGRGEGARASMGPRSENRGYAPSRGNMAKRRKKL